MKESITDSIWVLLVATTCCLVLTSTLHAEAVDNWRDTIVVRDRGRVMNFDVQRREWVARPYMLVRPYSEGVAVAIPNDDLEEAVEVSGRPQVYVDLSGNLALPGYSVRAHSFHEGRAIVRKERRETGVIDTRGRWIVEPTASISPIDEPSEGTIPFLRMTDEGSATGWIDLDGVVLAEMGDAAGPGEAFHNGLALTATDSGLGYVDQTGQIRIELSQQGLGGGHSFSNGLAVVDRWDRGVDVIRYGYIDMNGEIAIEVRFRQAEPFSNGLASVSRDDGTWIFIDRTGEQAFAGEFENAGAFHERRAAVRIDGKWGFINTEGEIVVEPQYLHVEDFVDGYAEVVRRFPPEDGKEVSRRGWIDRDGEVVIPFELPWSRF